MHLGRFGEVTIAIINFSVEKKKGGEVFAAKVVSFRTDQLGKIIEELEACHAVLGKQVHSQVERQE